MLKQPIYTCSTTHFRRYPGQTYREHCPPEGVSFMGWVCPAFFGDIAQLLRVHQLHWWRVCDDHIARFEETENLRNRVSLQQHQCSA